MASSLCLVRADGAARLRRSAAQSADICHFAEIFSVKPNSLRLQSRDFGPVFPIETSVGIHNAWRELYYASALALGFSAFCSVPCFMRQPAAAFQFKEFPDVDVFD